MSASSAIRMFGIKNCDSCRRARQFLAARGVAYQFIDLRETPPDRAMLEQWAGRCDWRAILNKRSRTWKQLDGSQQMVDDVGSACQLMSHHPLLIKRPLLDTQSFFSVGFDEARWQDWLDA